MTEPPESTKITSLGGDLTRYLRYDIYRCLSAGAPVTLANPRPRAINCAALHLTRMRRLRSRRLNRDKSHGSWIYNWGESLLTYQGILNHTDSSVKHGKNQYLFTSLTVCATLCLFTYCLRFFFFTIGFKYSLHTTIKMKLTWLNP